MFYHFTVPVLCTVLGLEAIYEELGSWDCVRTDAKECSLATHCFMHCHWGKNTHMPDVVFLYSSSNLEEIILLHSVLASNNEEIEKKIQFMRKLKCH